MTGNAGLALLGALAAVVATSCADRPAGHTESTQPPGAGASTRDVSTDSTLLDRIALGARLFEDLRLSRDSTISCATCHMPSHAFAEPRAVSHGIGQRARKRNTPSLINVTMFRSSFDWDGRATTLQDQLDGVFSITGDMGIDIGEAVARVRADTSYEQEFRRAYGRPPDVDAFKSALVIFQKSLVVSGSRFDRFYLGGDSTALSESEKRGWRLFRSNKAGCAGCHIPLPDPGGLGHHRL
jgi:cytochrome c peroxidase